MFSLNSHPWALFIVYLVGLMVIVEIGLRLRLASSTFDEQRQSFIRSAQNGLTTLLSFLLAFALPMALPEYEQRWDRVVDEANAIATVDQRARMLPDPFRGKIIQLLREYVDTRIEFAARESDEHEVLASTVRAKQLQQEMSQETLAMIRQNPNLQIVPIFVWSLSALSDATEKTLEADQRRLPGTIWLVLTLISVLTCFVLGYSMGRRLFVAMFVLPLTVAIVLSLVSELDNPRTGFIRTPQESMQRLQSDLKMEAGPNR